MGMGETSSMNMVSSALGMHARHQSFAGERALPFSVEPVEAPSARHLRLTIDLCCSPLCVAFQKWPALRLYLKN